MIVVGYLGVSAFRLVLRPRIFRWPEPGALNLSVMGAAVFALYLAVSWAATGRSAGKQIMGLRAVRPDGSRIGLGRASVRAVVCVLFPFGLLWCAFDRQGRAVHDLIAGTSVVYDWRRRVTN